MKVHELFDLMTPVQRGPSLTESKALPAGEAGRAILTEALHGARKPSKPQNKPKMRLREFLLLDAAKQRLS